MLKQKFICIVSFILVSAAVFSQVAADPNDFFYSDLIRWEAKSLVSNLPPVRPYPLQLVKEILETVIQKGDKTQQDIAKNHYERFFGRSVSFGGKSEVVLDTAKLHKQLSLAISMDVNHFLEEKLSISASFEGWAVNKIHSNEILPALYVSDRDIIEDNAKVGPLYILPVLDSSLSYGTTEYYLNVGVMRGSFGPIHDNGVVLGSQAFHTGQFSLVANKETWGFNSSLFSLVATAANGDNADTKFFPGKFLTLHSIDYKPFPWFSISIFESVVYGGRFEPLYLIPFSAYMTSQALVGYNDNSWLGGMFTVKPIPGLKIDGVLYADDIGFKDIVTFKKEQKWRIAGQIGTSYSPVKSGLLNLVSFDYTMVTPYAYTHKEGEKFEYDAPNYQSYQHAGTPIGSTLEPNSDRVNISVSLTPLEKLDVTFIGTLVRHANINENLPQKWVREYVSSKDVTSYITDGSIKNHPFTNVGHAFSHSAPLLKQDTIQYIFQTGLDVHCRLPVIKTGGYMLFKLGYRFELDVNSGIRNNIYLIDPTLRGESEEVIDAMAAEQLQKWRSEATGRKMNNFISVGFEYFF